MPFQTPFERETAFKRLFPFKQSQGINKNAVYRFKRSSLPLIILTNHQPFQENILNDKRLTNEQRCKNILSLLDDALRKCCVSTKIFNVFFV